MPADASIYNLANQPTVALQNPLDIQARRIGIANALAGGQMTQLDLQQKRQAIADDQATRNAMLSQYGQTSPAAAPAVAPPAAALPGTINDQTGVAGQPLPSAPPMPAAAPAAPAAPAVAPPVPQAPPVPTMAYLIRRGVPPAQASALISQFQKIDETSATIGKTKAEALKAQKEANDLVSQQASDMANMLVKTAAPGQPINPDLLSWHLQHFASLGPQEAAQAQSVGAQLAQLSPADQVTFLQSLAGTPKTIEANAADTTANEKKAGSDREAANQARGQALSALAAQPNGAAYGAVWQKLPADLRADASIPNPAQWTPQTPAMLQNTGSTSEQQMTAAETAKRDAQTNHYQSAELGLHQAEFNLKTRGVMGQLNPDQQVIAKKLAAGDYSMSILSRFPAAEKEAIMAGALDINPGLTAQTFETKDSFTNPDKIQAKNLGTISRIVGHIGRFELNSQSLGVDPVYGIAGVNLGGTAKSLSEDSHAISGELEKLVSGGVGSEGQIKQWQSDLRSTLPGTRQKAVNEISQLVGSQYEGMAQTYRAGVGSELPVEKYLTPAAQAWMKSKGINLATSASSSPAAAPAVSAAPAGSVSVTDPTGGVHVFPDAASAQTFKIKAGIE